MATFRKRSNSWQARIQRTGYPDQAKTFKTRSEAVSWARQIESKLDQGAFPMPHHDVPLSDLLLKYLDTVTVKKRQPDTETYRINAWLKYPLARRPVQSIRSKDIADWRDGRIAAGKSANTIRLELAVLSNLFTVAICEWGFEGLSNPTKVVKLPRLPSGRIRRLEVGDIQKIVLNSDSSLLEPIVTLAVETAMRRGELAAMEWRDLNFSKSVLFLPTTKNGDSREIPLSPLALKTLMSLPRTQGRVFDVTPHAITIAFGRACKRAGITNLHFHDLRHEAISRLFERGFSIAEVAAISGHKTWAMLKRYTHLSAENLARKLAA